MDESHSSYLQYLPPVLWIDDVSDDVSDDVRALKIGKFLKMFEKILTGIDDDVVVSHRDHSHIDFETLIDNLHTLYNPWKTRTDFLPHLASWLSLQLVSSFDEYQKRKLTNEIVSVYQLRGLKQGLQKYFELFNVSSAKPRIVIDDGDTIFRIVLNNGLSSISQTLSNGHPLLRPKALAIDSLGNYIIVDQGDMGLQPPAGPGPIQPSLWKFTPNGDTGFTNVHKGPPLYTPTGIVLESNGAYVVLDAGSDISYSSQESKICRFSPPYCSYSTIVDATTPPPRDLENGAYAFVDSGQVVSNSSRVSGVYRFSPRYYTYSTIVDGTSSPPFPAVYPVDIVRVADGHFIVLDRGARFPHPAVPKILVIREGLSIDSYSLSNVSEPTSIALDNKGKLIVTDAGIVLPTTEEPNGKLLKADIFIIDINTIPVSEKSLLGALSENENPLIYPTAVVLEAPNHIIVSDLGVKPPDRSPRLAEPAALYRIPLPPTAPEVELINKDPNFVWPSDIVIDSNGAVIMLDYGESKDQYPERNWRSLTHEFGVIIYFSEKRIITTDEKRRIIGNISRIVDREKPAHSYWTLKTYE
jgi:phage tail-like protein